jgi:hypothetical protein
VGRGKRILEEEGREERRGGDGGKNHKEYLFWPRNLFPKKETSKVSNYGKGKPRSTRLQGIRISERDDLLRVLIFFSFNSLSPLLSHSSLSLPSTFSLLLSFTNHPSLRPLSELRNNNHQNF